MEINKKAKKLTDMSSIVSLDSVIRIGKKTAISREEDVEVIIPGPVFLTEFNVGDYSCLLILPEGAVEELRAETPPTIKTVQELIRTLRSHE